MKNTLSTNQIAQSLRADTNANMKQRIYRLYLAYLKSKNLTQSDLSFSTYKDMCQMQSYFFGRK